jgi:DNA ligase (NAD+)
MIDRLKENIIKANEAYRVGKPIISDSDYDKLIEELEFLSPNDDLLSKVGHKISDESRKAKLPIEMASMNKIKSLDDIKDWCRLKGISINETVILTPKFDGLSLCEKDNIQAWTRGDGVLGQKSNGHYKLIGNHGSSYNTFKYTYGEVIMPKKVFIDKYSNDYANPRNLVAGLLNSKEATEALRDCVYIKYGGVTDSFNTKQEILDELNKYQDVKVEYQICKISELTEDLMISLFKQYSIDFEIDGLIIEINDLSLQNKLGRETSSNNPVWARAFKHQSFEQSAETDVIGISWNISKQGYLKPILHVKPIKLDGVTVSNVTGNNARFVKDMGLGVGSRVKIVRSGMVIPLIVDVLITVDFVMPEIDGIDVIWNENGVELITATETDDQKLKKIVAFFEILEADNFSEGVIKQLWISNYKTINDILSLGVNDLEKIDGFGKRKSKIVYDSIKKSIKNVSLSKLMHASGLFGNGLGSKKLALLEHFKTKPTVDQVMDIDGFAETTAKNFVDNYDKFFEFVKELPITIEEKIEVVKKGNSLDGKTFVFTGVRDKEAEDKIVSLGGKIGSSVSKNTTHLVVKIKGSGSSKEVKAIELGIQILSLDDLKKILLNG